MSVGEKEKVKKGRGGSKGRKMKRRTKNMNPTRFIIQKKGGKGLEPLIKERQENKITYTHTHTHMKK